MDFSWLARPAHVVAPELLGHTLVRQIGQIEYRGLIVETEAYGPGDPACHAYVRKTERNSAIFGTPGLIYVYLIYGTYHCVNIVTEAEGVGSAVLLRALQLDQIPEWVSLKEKSHRVGAGPGKLCRALQIDRSLNGSFLEPSSQLWLESRSPDFNFTTVQTTRIGITKGVDIPWRWYIKDHPAVSKK